mgnify:CR=1 FL=1
METAIMPGENGSRRGSWSADLSLPCFKNGSRAFPSRKSAAVTASTPASYNAGRRPWIAA